MQHDGASVDTSEQRLRRLFEEVHGEGVFDLSRLRIRSLPKSRSGLAYFDLGDPEGTPLLCLHGLSVSGFCFDQFHRYFAARGIRAIAPCLLGGIYIPDPSKTIQDLAGQVIELLDLLAIDRFDVIGFSWGTLTELAMVARVPRRIGRAGFLGPMVPLKFLDASEVSQMKSDVRLSISMARRVPALHRWLMWVVCQLPVSTLLDQFKDDKLSVAEARALAPDSAFGVHLSHCIEECTGTGSRFFTDGWRMFLDEPGYVLSDLASLGSQIELRLYVGEHDNVHPPSNATLLAAAFAGTTRGELTPAAEGRGTGVFREVYAHGQCSVRMAPGAGRLACVLYLQEALDDLLPSDRHHGSKQSG